MSINSIGRLKFNAYIFVGKHVSGSMGCHERFGRRETGMETGWEIIKSLHDEHKKENFEALQLVPWKGHGRLPAGGLPHPLSGPRSADEKLRFVPKC